MLGGQGDVASRLMMGISTPGFLYECLLAYLLSPPDPQSMGLLKKRGPLVVYRWMKGGHCKVGIGMILGNPCIPTRALRSSLQFL